MTIRFVHRGADELWTLAIALAANPAVVICKTFTKGNYASSPTESTISPGLDEYFAKAYAAVAGDLKYVNPDETIDYENTDAFAVLINGSPTHYVFSSTYQSPSVGKLARCLVWLVRSGEVVYGTIPPGH